MKAVLCKAFGEPESLVIEDIPSPVPGPGEVLVDVHASAVNFPDVLMIAGKYQSKPPFPFSPGGELAGTVAAIGPECERFAVGDRVFGGIGHGAFAEQIAVPENRLRAMPHEMSFAEASAISTTYGTSYYALKQRANLQPGETLLVLGAGGGVGLAAVELGACMGARVIAAASSDEKLAAAKSAGAHELINYSDGQLKDKVKALTDGQGVDVIYDPVVRSVHAQYRLVRAGVSDRLCRRRNPQGSNKPHPAQVLPVGWRVLRSLERQVSRGARG
jgi:NADPH2:quinone reductase